MSNFLDLRAPPDPTDVPVRPLRWPAFLAAGYGSACAALLVAWWLVGDTWLTQSLNATTFWWSLPGLPLMVIAGMRRRWRLAACLVVPAATFVSAYGAFFVGSAPTLQGELRVAAYNTYIRAPDLSHILSLASDERPDVLLLEEVLPQPAALLRRALSDRFPHAWVSESSRVGGVAVFSRYPIVEVRPVEKAGRSSRPTAIVVIEVDKRPRGDLLRTAATGDRRERRRVQLVPVHLTSPCPSCGESVLGRQAFEAAIRRQETEAIIRSLDLSLPAVVGGDFNSTSRNDPYRMLVAAGFRDAQMEAGSGPGFTWADKTPPLLRLDWVLSRGLVAADARVGPARASDHRPVIVDLAWPE